jgi:hypothetical protein
MPPEIAASVSWRRRSLISGVAMAAVKASRSMPSGRRFPAPPAARRCRDHHPVGAEHRVGKLPRLTAVLPVQPVVAARRSQRGDRKPGRERIGQAHEARRTFDVALAVFALERHGQQEGQARYLERSRNHDRAPLHLAPVFRRKLVDALAGEVGVRRGKVEPELDGLSHELLLTATKAYEEIVASGPQRGAAGAQLPECTSLYMRARRGFAKHASRRRSRTAVQSRPWKSTAQAPIRHAQ